VPDEWQWYPGNDAYQQTHLDNRLGFAGYVWDPWLKVYHVRHRVYDPFDTRWLQADPIGYAGGDADLRRYSHGDPVNKIDPLGLWGWDGDWVEGAARAIAGALGIGDPQNAVVTDGFNKGAHDGFVVTNSAATRVITFGLYGDTTQELAAAGKLHDPTNPSLQDSEASGNVMGAALLAALVQAVSNAAKGAGAAEAGVEGGDSCGGGSESPTTPSRPPNNGFAGDPIETTLEPGTPVDRIGSTNGRFMAPEGTPFPQRSMPGPEVPATPYEVTQPVPGVMEGPTAPWYGQPGGGTQYVLPKPLQWYIDNGFMRPK
jgi:RHS repeat-associated protein